MPNLMEFNAITISAREYRSESRQYNNIMQGPTAISIKGVFLTRTKLALGYAQKC